MARVVGSWRLEQPIGSGSFAVVWRARHCTSGVLAAVKEINTARLSGKLQASLASEVSVLQRTSHRNLVGLLDMVQVGDWTGCARACGVRWLLTVTWALAIAGTAARAACKRWRGGAWAQAGGAHLRAPRPCACARCSGGGPAVPGARVLRGRGPGPLPEALRPRARGVRPAPAAAAGRRPAGAAGAEPHARACQGVPPAASLAAVRPPWWLTKACARGLPLLPPPPPPPPPPPATSSRKTCCWPTAPRCRTSRSRTLALRAACSPR